MRDMEGWDGSHSPYYDRIRRDNRNLQAQLTALREVIECVLAQPMEYADVGVDRRILRNGLEQGRKAKGEW